MVLSGFRPAVRGLPTRLAASDQALLVAKDGVHALGPTNTRAASLLMQSHAAGPVAERLDKKWIGDADQAGGEALGTGKVFELGVVYREEGPKVTSVEEGGDHLHEAKHCVRDMRRGR